MQVFKRSIWIARPRTEVFDYFIDFERASEWRSYVRTMEQVGEGPLRAGSHVHAVLDIAGEEVRLDMEVLTFERPALWQHRTDEIDFRDAIEYRFVPEREGTRVTLTGTARPVSLYGWLAVPLLWLGRRRAYTDQLPQLKRALEAAQ